MCEKRRRAGDSMGMGPRSVPLRVAKGNAAERILGMLAIAMSRFS